MKRILIVILIVFGIILVSKNTSNVLIPKDAIRFRVIANSNTKEDQDLKKEVSKVIQEDLYPKLLTKTSKEEAKEFLVNYQDEISNKVNKTIKDNNINSTYNINYGINHFPKKTYKGVEYPEGDYESLVITLGNASGNNWWCVLFPPLCLLEAEKDEQVEEVQYKSFVKELIDKYFK